MKENKQYVMLIERDKKGRIVKNQSMEVNEFATRLFRNIHFKKPWYISKKVLDKILITIIGQVVANIFMMIKFDNVNTTKRRKKNGRKKTN